MNQLLEAIKTTFKYACPMAGARLIGTASGLISMLMIAQLGRYALAAGALISTLATMIFVIAWTILFSLSVLVGRAYGEKNMESIGPIVRQSWILGTLIGLPMMLIFWMLPHLLEFFGQPHQIVIIIQHYFNILAFASIPSMWTISFMQFVSAVARPRDVVYIMIFSLIVTVVSGYSLLFGKFGMPAVGINGMAYATNIAYWLTAILGVLILYFNPYYRSFRIFECSKMKDFNYLKLMLVIGYPIAIQLGGELTAFAFSTLMVGWFGEAALAAQQIVLQIGMVVLMAPYGISQASTILIGHALGRNNPKEVKAYGEAAIILGVLFTLMIAIFYFTAPDLIISWFAVNIHDPKNAELIHIAVMLLGISAVSQMFDAIRNISTGSLRAFHDTKIPMLVGLIASWGISIPLGYLLGVWFHLGAAGIRAGYIAGWIFGAIMLVRRFYLKAQKYNMNNQRINRWSRFIRTN